LQPFQFEPRGLDQRLVQVDIPAIPHIEVHTPFFWSVGPNNLQLQRMEPAGAIEAAALPSPEASGSLIDGSFSGSAAPNDAIVGPYFAQTARDWLFNDTSNLVFVLPK
jgi:hypothetical protein